MYHALRSASLHSEQASNQQIEPECSERLLSGRIVEARKVDLLNLERQRTLFQAAA
jgi:hypothetical protein